MNLCSSDRLLISAQTHSINDINSYVVEPQQANRNKEKVIALLGEELYNRTPILDLTACKYYPSYKYTNQISELNFIEIEDLTAPIMRGEDQWGRHFVVIRFQVHDNHYMDKQKKYYEIFYQKDPSDSEIWNSYAPIYSFTESEIAILYHEPYRTWENDEKLQFLGKMIRNGKNEYYLKFKKAIFISNPKLYVEIM